MARARAKHAAPRRQGAAGEPPPSTAARSAQTGDSPQQTAARDRWPRACVVLASVAVFARAVPYPLQRSWDDGRFILDNADVRHPSVAALARIVSNEHFEAYHPLHLLSYWLDVPWFGANPWVIHGVSLGLWVLALLLVYAALRALRIAPWHAALATLVCGIHPVQVEAVSWATGRKDVLAMLFVGASLLLHLRARSSWDSRAWGSRACYALALLSKTTALPLPLFILLLDVVARRARLRDALLRQLPSLLLAAAAGTGVMLIWRDHTMLRTNVGGPELAALRFIQTLGHQLLTAIWPAHTAPMYAIQRVVELDPLRSACVALWLLACVLAYRKRARLIAVGLLGFAILLLPVSNLVPMYFPLQDRYLSLPLLALALACAGALQTAAASGERNAVGLMALLVIALGLRTSQYTGVWRSDVELWGHAVRTQPDADYGWLKLGEVRRERGDLEGAMKAYQGAVHAAPLRKLAHAALFEAVALRDERIRGDRRPSRARALAQRYYEQLDSTRGLRELAAELMQGGYPRALELPMQIVIARERLPDDALERLAQIQLNAGQLTLARFYASAMHRPPKDEALKSLLDQPYVRVLP